MKYFNLKSLIIFLILNGIALYLNIIWTSDKGWIPFMIFLFGVFSILFWLIISFVSFLKKSNLKMEIYYFFVLGIWSIFMTIDYFKLKIFDGEFISYIPYGLFIVLSALPVKRIWTKRI